MSGGRLVLPLAEPALTAQGFPASGATLTVYLTGTTTLADLFADVGLAAEIKNPQTSNAAGRFYDQSTAIYADPAQAYDCVLTLADGEAFSFEAVQLVTAPGATSGFAPINSPQLTGTPTAPTPAANDASSKIATTQFVQAAIAAASLTAPGTIGMFAATALPSGWLSLCKNAPNTAGEAVSRTTYAALFGKIGTTFGAGDGATTFNLPNLSGVFPRGLDPTSSLGVALGSVQLDAMQGHLHGPLSPFTTFMGKEPGGGRGTSSGGNDNETMNTTGAPVTDGTNGTPRVASETRPINTPLVFAIKT